MFIGTGRARWIPSAIVAVVALALGLATFDAKLSLSGDNAEFIILARSLAQGQGLSHINLPQPEPATKYPFGFPLMLAPFAWLWPSGWVAMKVLVVVLFAGGMVVLYELLAPRVGRAGALGATVVCMLLGNSGHSGGPLLLDYAHQVMSEVPYLTFSLLSLLLLQRALQRPGLAGNWEFPAAFAAAMWAYYVRSIGVVLLTAVCVHLLWRRDLRRAGLWAAATGICWLPWSLRNRAVGGSAAYLKQLVMVNPYYPQQGLLDLPGVAARLAGNVREYATTLLPQTFWPWSPPPHAPSNLPVLLFVGLAVYATYRALRHGRDLLPWLYAVMYLGTIFLWFWQGDRFLVPIVPLLVYFVAVAMKDLDDGAHRRGYGSVARVAILVVMVLWLAAGIRGTTRLRSFSRGDYPPALRAWSNYQRAGEFLRERTDPDAVVMCRKGYWLYVVSHRRCVPYPFSAPDSILAEMNRYHVQYVVVESLGFSQTPRFLVPAINAHRRDFQVVWQRTDPPTFVLRYAPNEPNSSP